MSSTRPIPTVKIVHQPSQVYRMRYKAEKRTTFLYAENFQSADKAKGDNLSPGSSAAQANKKAALPRKKAVLGSNANDHPDGMFPKIEIVNGEGPATLIVSCVSYTEPHYVHPHRLVGESCKSGVAVLNIDKGEKTFELVGVSIEFTKRHDIDESINELRAKNVDPFNAGFDFPRDKIDLTRVRLCFQVYLRDSLSSNTIIRDHYHILKPVLSNVIYNSSRKTTLQILRTANLSSPASGGRILTIFLKKLEKDQKKLSAKFFDQSNWSRTVEIHDFHYQCAVMLEAPPFKQQDISTPVRVNLKLFVPFKDDKEKSEFINKQQNEDNDDEFDENDEPGMTSTQASASPSASASASLPPSFSYNSSQASTSAMLGASIPSQTEMFREIPDGKYESRVLEFTYFPPEITNSKRKLDVYSFYDFSETAEKDLTNEISEESRSRLAKRQREIIEEDFDAKLPRVFQDKTMHNTVNYNFAMKHNSIMGAMQVDQYPEPPQFQDSSSINWNQVELRDQIDSLLNEEIMMTFGGNAGNDDPTTYDFESLTNVFDPLDGDFLNTSNMPNDPNNDNTN